MDSMQYEALRRAQEMHSRMNNQSTQKNSASQSSVQTPAHQQGGHKRESQGNQQSSAQSYQQHTAQSNRQTNQQNPAHKNSQSNHRDSSPPFVPQREKTQENKDPQPEQKHSEKSPKSSAADSLFQDKEKLLILLLILILSSEEGSDPAVILALLYLII